ncbi:MAG: hypothetical protein E6Q93_25215 [Burkholderiaceae bacterium]|nr:MAG: hypothetical protein E6Q93_25215 [Burkholderiaceae bacterium]
MIRSIPLLATLALLAACATEPATTAQAQSSGCGVSDARTGSLVVRREACVPTTEEERAAARRQMESMQREQERQRRGAGPSGT